MKATPLPGTDRKKEETEATFPMEAAKRNPLATEAEITAMVQTDLQMMVPKITATVRMNIRMTVPEITETVRMNIPTTAPENTDGL